MATDVIVPSAPAAAPSSAPSSAPAAPSAPVSSPVSAPVETAPSSNFGSSTPTSKVDPAKYPIREDYAKALLAEKMGSINPEEAPAETAVLDPASATEEVKPAEVPDPASPAAEEAKPAEAKPADPVVEEEDFQLEPEAPITPETLSKMVTDNPEFGKLLEADPKLKGQLYKTAREAAELAPYKEIFPDVESAKSASQGAATFNEVRDVFMGSTTKEGTVATLGKLAELSYDRDDQGNVILDAQGQPKIGEDFYGFVDNVVGLDLEHRDQEVSARLAANRYASEADRERDEQRKAALDILRGDAMLDAPAEELPAALKQREDDIARREAELNQRTQTEKVSERQGFEKDLQGEATKRINDGISRIIANVEKQGAELSPYLKNILPKAIGAKLMRKIQANPSIQSQMRELQRLPIGDTSKTRRLAAIDRAIQQYLPEVARAELREAGVQTKATAEQKYARVKEQAELTRKTDPKGSTGAPSSHAGNPMAVDKAYDTAKAEWTAQNPGRRFDKAAEQQILGRVIQLQLGS